MQDGLPAGCSLVPLTVRGDERGSLVVIEQCRDVPFAIARVYYLFGTRAGVTRGLHAHRVTRQFAVAVRGSCTILLDDGARRDTLRLDDSSVGLILPPMTTASLNALMS